MGKYFKLLRVKHYIKNLLLFVPAFFGGEIFDIYKMRICISGMIAFCAISSIVYILNDLQDAERDRMHPVKRYRPIACGAISKRAAVISCSICLIIAIIFASLTGKAEESFIYIFLYLFLNIVYSYGLKNKPLIDVFILSSGFSIRVFYGGMLTETEISSWLYLIVIVGSLYMGLGKRRNEMKIKESGNTREVLKYYTYAFLDKNMYVCVTLVNVFYALWAMELSVGLMQWTIPLVIAILMKYSLNVEGESDGDPVEVVVKDKVLIGLIGLYIVSAFLVLYII